MNAKNFGLVMTSLVHPSARPPVRPYAALEDNQCEACAATRVNCVLEKIIIMIILTEYKVNFCDQQREKEQYDWQREKQIGLHIIRILK